MSIGHDVHPLAMRVRADLEWFNKPCGVACNNCMRPIVQGAPVPWPIVMQPLTHTSNDVQVIRVHKNFCHKHCLARAHDVRDQNPMVMRNMLVDVYGHDPQKPIRPALPFWALREYGGILTSEEFDAWALTGRCEAIETRLAALVPEDILTAFVDGSMDEVERYRRAYDVVKRHNRFAQFVFDDTDAFWATPLRAEQQLFCWNDGHLIEGQIALPVVRAIDPFGRYECEGLFCSVACKCSYINRHLRGQFKHQRLTDWDGTFNSKYYFGGRALDTQRAASRRLLKLFGGPLSIADFRSGKSRYRQVRPAEIQKYPVQVIEERPGVFSVSNEKRTWNYMNQPLWLSQIGHVAPDMPLDNLPAMNLVTLSDCDENVIELNPVYHRVDKQPSTAITYLLLVDLLTIETDEPIVSNQAILHELITEAQPKVKTRPQLHTGPTLLVEDNDTMGERS